ncbi:hypothetical protein SAMN03159340_02687 [Sphingomonas sp. NFR15]|nr:hypothetical protein SAMN03159340_02687 [Sphingomonas sp. NFR15]
MRRWRMICAGVAALAGTGAITAAVPDPGASVALSRIERGQYEIKVVGSEAPGRSVCIADAAMLLQMQHPGAACTRLVMADSPDSTTVNYTCSSGGHGRTVVTITTPRSFDIDTQGIASGAPFDLNYQGRRVGPCPARSTASR